MKRRDFIAAIGGALAAPLAQAQAVPGRRTLGVLSMESAPPTEKMAQLPHWRRLGELGWHEGTNLAVEHRYAGGRVALLAGLAADLASKKVDAIWAHGSEPALAAARATKSIPIVFWGAPFPVEQGLVDSLPRPGGNVTGVAFYADLGAVFKQFEVLFEIAPHVRRIFSFTMPSVVSTLAGGDLRDQIRGAGDSFAKAKGLDLTRHDIRNREDLEPAFAAILESKSQAVTVLQHPLTVQNMGRIVEFLNSNRLVGMFNTRVFVEAGGLFSYGPDYGRIVLDSTRLLDRVLRGAKPADLPTEEPSRYELALNLKTAAHLGLKVSRSIIVRADRLIE